MMNEKIQIKKQIYPALLLFAGMVVGGGAVAAYTFFVTTTPTMPSYQFTNPNLQASQFKESFSSAGRNQLQKKLIDLVAQKEKEGGFSQTGIYFRDLNNGPVFGINQDVEFAPASLLKLPLAIAYYREWEDNDPGILDQQILFNGPKGVSEVHYPPPQSVVPGSTYTVRQLLEFMLEDSDNDATSILGQFLSQEKVNSVYKDLGIKVVDNYNMYTTTVRDYAAFFRILYNATYLDQPSSESLLGVLTKSTFDAGIIAGLPSGTLVAHKFGERTLDEKAPTYQLNDCGIIYAPQHPYILCVMTQGNSYEKLAGLIKEISAEVYSGVTTFSYEQR